MLTNDVIDQALAVIEKASKGPARWVEPATGVDADGKRRDPCLAFAEMLNASQWTGEKVSFEQAMHDSENCIVHGVSIPIEGEKEIRDGGDHRVIAITGNGTASEANARMIAAAMSPDYGWAAALLEIKRLRAELAEHFPISITARAFVADEATANDVREIVEKHLSLTPEQQLSALPPRLGGTYGR